MPGAVGADVRATGHAVDVGGDLLEQRPERLVGLRGPARHDRRAVEGPFLTTGDARADEMQSALTHRLLATDRVGVQRIATVDDDVTVLHGVGELVDDRVGGLTRLDHDEHTPRLLQRIEEFGDGLAAHEVAVGAVLGKQRVGLGHGAVVQRDRVAVPGEIARDVRPHHGQSGHSDLGGPGGRRSRVAHAAAFRWRIVRRVDAVTSTTLVQCPRSRSEHVDGTDLYEKTMQTS